MLESIQLKLSEHRNTYPTNEDKYRHAMRIRRAQAYLASKKWRNRLSRWLATVTKPVGKQINV